MRIRRTGGYQVSDTCRGCLAHHCVEVCPKGAISFDKNQRAHIDPSLCVGCGACANACLFRAIHTQTRPCESSCPVGAIYPGANQSAEIDYEKCIGCGNCIRHCPFGAIMDKSYILNVIDLLKKSRGDGNYKVWALVAPSIGSQFSYATPSQIVTALYRLGFDGVTEVAEAADAVALHEAEELKDKEFMTSSCCPSFVTYIEKYFPELKKYVSTSPSPMALMGRMFKEADPTCKTVFVGPCVGKKLEYRRPEVAPYIDSVITFEELEALFAARSISPETLPETPLDGASALGRGFAQIGGVTEAIKTLSSPTHDTVVCNGIEECRIALMRLTKGKLPSSFIEGMACQGGCVSGAGCLTHAPSAARAQSAYIAAAPKKTPEMK